MGEGKQQQQPNVSRSNPNSSFLYFLFLPPEQLHLIVKVGNLSILLPVWLVFLETHPLWTSLALPRKESKYISNRLLLLLLLLKRERPDSYWLKRLLHFPIGAYIKKALAWESRLHCGWKSLQIVHKKSLFVQQIQSLESQFLRDVVSQSIRYQYIKLSVSKTFGISESYCFSASVSQSLSFRVWEY